MLASPKGHLLSALLWNGPLPAQRIELRWPEGSAVPPTEAIEVRVYPTDVGWFGFVFHKALAGPAVSADGRTMTYLNEAQDPQGKKISVKNAPTHFGTVAYEIVSDVDNGKITATVEMPARKAPKEVVLRFRHPKSAPIKGVTVNGKPWTEFNKDKETIALKGLTGTVAVTAQY